MLHTLGPEGLSGSRFTAPGDRGRAALRTPACVCVLALAAVLALPAPLSARLVICEVLYHPFEGRPEGESLEFVEIFNDEPLPFDMTGYRLEGGISYRFPPDTVIEAEDVLVVALSPDLIEATFGIERPLGPFVGRLDNDGDDLMLVDSGGSVVSRVEYRDRGRWPTAADGAGPSLVLRDPLLDTDRGESWGWSPQVDGTPGVVSFEVAPSEILINEVGRPRDEPGWIELFNPGYEALDLEGYRLWGDPAGSLQFVFASGTIAPRGLVVVDGPRLGFPLAELDQRVFLVSREGRLVDAHRLDDALEGVSEGRHPDGAISWYRLKPSPSESNVWTPPCQLVVSEIHYHPFSGDPADEFIEIVNLGAECALDGFTISGGIAYSFPEGITVARDEYLVIARDPAQLEASRGVAGALGPFEGVLSNSGETIRVRDPLGNPVDELRYFDEGDWSRWADGDGPSLELVDLRQDNSVGTAWRESDHAALSEWHSFEYTATQKGGDSEFHLFLLGAGEILIDDIEVVALAGGDNLIPNGDFDGDRPLSGWTIQGTHVDSRIEEGGGTNGSNALRVVASKRGDTRVNRLEIQTSPSLIAGREYTVRFRARWLRGCNALMTRSWGHGLARVHHLPVPPFGGTPGQPNSVAAANTGPLLHDLRQAPVLPEPGEAVTISVRASDPDGVASVTLHHRLDGDGAFTTAAMLDDGSGADLHEGDGIYSASIEYEDAGRADVAEFFVAAEDGRGALRSYPPERTLLYQYDDGIAPHAVPAYRLVMTARDYQTLRTRSPHSNHRLPASLVYRDERIFHEATVRYRGSPYLRRPAVTGVRKGFRVRLSDQNPLRTSVRVTLDEQLADQTRQVDRLVRHFLQKAGGIPYGERRHVHMIVRGSNFNTYEEVLTVDPLYLRRAFGDAQDDGDLYKIDAHYELTDDGINFSGNPVFTSWKYTDDREELRFIYKKRSREREDDWSSLIDLLDVMDIDRTPTDELDARAAASIDLDLWIRGMAVYRAVDDWDTIGGWTGKNVYLYRPPGAPWKYIPWDHDVALGAAALQGDQNCRAYLFTPYFPEIQRLLRRPANLRKFYAELLRLLAEDYDRAVVDPVLDRTYDLLSTSSGGVSAPSAIKSFISCRRSHILSQIGASPDFAITTGGGAPFVTEVSPVSLRGEAPYAAEFILNRELAVDPLRWLDEKTWEISLPLAPGENRVELVALDRRGDRVGEASTAIRYDPPGAVFRRAEVNGDASVDVSDVVRILMHQFLGDPVDCTDAADADDSGAIDVADPVYLLDYLFLGGPEPPPPFHFPGVDPTADALDCAIP